MAKRWASSRDRIFWRQSPALLVPLTISLKWPAIIGGALLKLAASCWAEGMCDNVYYFCMDEDHLYKEWEEFARARPKYISIMDGMITEDDKQEMNKKENA
jgi:hypothetical protein